MAIESLIIRARQNMERLRSSIRDTQNQTGGLQDELAQVVDSLERAAKIMDRRWVERLRRTGATDAQIIERAEQARQDQIRSRELRNNPPGAGQIAPPSAAPAPDSTQATQNAERLAASLSSKIRRAIATSGIIAWAFGGMNRAADADTANDRLMRVTRGLSGGFDNLRRRIDETASSSKLSVEETARLSEHFAKLSGRVDSTTALAETEAGVLASRAMGLDQGVMPQWLAEMRYKGMGDAKALLPLVAATVSRSGLQGRSEEILDGLLEYTERMERVSLKAPDLQKFTDLITTFNLQKDLPGLRGAAGMQVYAGLDAAIRQPGAGEAGEMLMYSYFAKNGYTDLFAAKKQREKGLAGLPGGLEGLLKYIATYTGLTGDALDVAAGNALNMSPLAIESLRKIDFSKTAGGTGGFMEWLQGKGVDLDKIRPDAYQSMADLYAAVEGKDSATIEGLGQRYLTPEQQTKLKGAELVDAILEAMVTKGKDQTRLDMTLDRMATMANLQEQAGRTLLDGVNLLFDWAKNELQDWGRAIEQFRKSVERFSAVTEKAASLLGLGPERGFLGNMGGAISGYIADSVEEFNAGGDDTNTGWRGLWNSLTGRNMKKPPQPTTPPPPATVPQAGRAVGGTPTGREFAWQVFQAELQRSGDVEEAYLAAAQAAQETGWGRHSVNNNYFGIKGPGGKFATYEWRDGRMVRETASFRGYADLADSVAGRAEFLRNNPRYAQSGYFAAMTAEERAAALGAAGYATDPNYAANLQNIIGRLRAEFGFSPVTPSQSDYQDQMALINPAYNGPGFSPVGGGPQMSYTDEYAQLQHQFNITLFNPQGDVVGQQTQQMTLPTPIAPAHVAQLRGVVDAAVADWLARRRAQAVGAR